MNTEASQLDAVYLPNVYRRNLPNNNRFFFPIFFLSLLSPSHFHCLCRPSIGFIHALQIDTRVEHLPFLGSPIPIVVLIVTYVYTVTIWGPNIMKPRKAYDLKGVIKIYNLIQIFTNLYIGIVVSGLSFLSVLSLIIFNRCLYFIYSCICRSRTRRQRSRVANNRVNARICLNNNFCRRCRCCRSLLLSSICFHSFWN